MKRKQNTPKVNKAPIQTLITLSANGIGQNLRKIKKEEERTARKGVMEASEKKRRHRVPSMTLGDERDFCGARRVPFLPGTPRKNEQKS